MENKARSVITTVSIKIYRRQLIEIARKQLEDQGLTTPALDLADATIWPEYHELHEEPHFHQPDGIEIRFNVVTPVD